MNDFSEKLKENPIIYVTRDIERALGLDVETSGYFIVANHSDFAEKVSKGRDNILLIKDERILDTWQLLKNKKVADFINEKKASLVVFKNTPQIERICEANNWDILNPSAELASKVEEKLSQVKWLGGLKKYLPKHKIKKLKDVKWRDKEFIIQFNRTHTGQGTILVKTEQELKDLQKNFPERPVKASKYIPGIVFTNNNIALDDRVLVGNISYQITGIKPFTDLEFSTIGNDWGVVKNILNQEQIDVYKNIVQDIGDRLIKSGWKGLFGVDIVLGDSGELFLIEINARQPASSVFESKLQEKAKQKEGMTVFESHILGLLKEKNEKDIIKIDNGAQIIQRNIADIEIDEATIKNLKEKGFEVIEYKEGKENSDLLRMQSDKSLMEEHNILNKKGEEIAVIINKGESMENMEIKTLTSESLGMINNYLRLPFGGKEVNCPYFNNKKSGARSSLSVMVGKGNPQEIVEEAEIIAMRKKIKIKDLDNENLKKFLVDSNIGVDCSGFAFYVLNEEIKARKGGNIKKYLKLPLIKNFFRKILAKIRMVNNVNVLTLAHGDNSKKVDLKDVLPGDMVILLLEGRNHVLIIHKIDYEKGMPKNIYYTHSIAWGSDGIYNHGVRQGVIKITNLEKDLFSQKWSEEGKDVLDKFRKYKLGLRRLKIFI